MNNHCKRVKLFILRIREDSPRASTGAKLLRLRMASKYFSGERLPGDKIVLYPYAPTLLSRDDIPADSKPLNIIAVDRSWKKLLDDKRRPRELRKAMPRRLPLFVAANPINYGKAYLLSTAEALASSLLLLGCREKAVEVLKPFKWGNQFFELNKKIINIYSRHVKRSDLEMLERQVKEMIMKGAGECQE